MGDPSGPNQGRKVTKPAGRESGVRDRLKQPEITGTVEDKELECYHFWKFEELRVPDPRCGQAPTGPNEETPGTDTERRRQRNCQGCLPRSSSPSVCEPTKRPSLVDILPPPTVTSHGPSAMIKTAGQTCSVSGVQNWSVLGDKPLGPQNFRGPGPEGKQRLLQPQTPRSRAPQPPPLGSTVNQTGPQNQGLRALAPGNEALVAGTLGLRDS